MDYTKILKRAWSILWSYRILWIFGVLVALFSGTSRGPNFNYNFNSFDNPNFPGQMPRFDDMPGLERMLRGLFTGEAITAVITIAVVLICLVLILGIIGTIIRYVSHTALIRMVDEHERSSEKAGFRQGWRWGWSRAAWRLFLIDVLISIPTILVVLGALGCGLLFFAVTGASAGDGRRGGFIVALIGLVLLVVMVVFLVSIVISLIQPIIRRFAVLENAGVIDSIKGGFGLIRRRFVDVFLMWLILVGLAIAFGLVMIPVVLFLLAGAMLVGGGVGLATYFLMLQAAGQAAAITAGVILGLPLFVLIMAVPSLFLEGLRQVYGSTAWTLAYRELAAPLPAIPAGAEIVDLPEPGVQL